MNRSSIYIPCLRVSGQPYLVNVFSGTIYSRGLKFLQINFGNSACDLTQGFFIHDFRKMVSIPLCKCPNQSPDCSHLSIEIQGCPSTLWPACHTGGSPGDISEEPETRRSEIKVGEWAVTSLHLHHSSFSNPSIALPTSQLILQPFRCFTYVTAHSPTRPLLYLRHRSFSNPSFASPTSQALHYYILLLLTSWPGELCSALEVINEQILDFIKLNFLLGLGRGIVNDNIGTIS